MWSCVVQIHFCHLEKVSFYYLAEMRVPFHFVSLAQSWLNMEESGFKSTCMSGILKKKSNNSKTALQGQSSL